MMAGDALDPALAQLLVGAGSGGAGLVLLRYLIDWFRRDAAASRDHNSDTGAFQRLEAENRRVIAQRDAAQDALSKCTDERIKDREELAVLRGDVARLRAEVASLVKQVARLRSVFPQISPPNN